MALTILTKEQALQDAPPAIFVYGPSGVGKTALLGTAVEAGLIPLIINAERGVFKQSQIDRIESVGGHIAVIDNARDLAGLSKKLPKGITMVGVDSLTDICTNNILRLKPGEADPRKAYGQNIDEIMLFLWEMRSLGVVFVVTALDKWDRLFGGITPDKDQQAPTEYRYMPALPGQLEFMSPGRFDVVGRMALTYRGQSTVRELQIRPSKQYVSKSRYKTEDITEPTLAKLIADWPGRPQPICSDEETQKHLREDAGL